MDGFHDLRAIVNTIAIERPLDQLRYGELLGGTFQESPQKLPYHRVFIGNMRENSGFSHCELRLPRSDQATSAMVLCDIAPKAKVTTEAVMQAYGSMVEPVFPSPQEPLESPHYLRVQNPQKSISVSFGHPPETNIVTSMVIDLKVHP